MTVAPAPVTTSRSLGRSRLMGLLEIFRVDRSRKTNYGPRMEWLNYHHLLYFWVVARQGSIARASTELHLAKPTISGQIHRLEHVLGQKLFTREGRRLMLTEVGRVAFGYADEIFSLGREFLETLKGRGSGRSLDLAVGVTDALPKLVAFRLLEPALTLSEPVRIVCREERPDRLFADLSVHELDVVLSDSPMGPDVRVRGFNHLLGESGVSFFGTRQLAAAQRRRFPGCLDGAPMLLPGPTAALRRALEQWFDSCRIRPRIVGEFEDSSLLHVFGQLGTGFFPAPSIIESDVRQRYGVQRIGRTNELRERYYAISVERKLKHPAVVAITEAARRRLFR